MINLKIKNKSNNELPKYETNQSAGMDIRAFIDEPITLKHMERAVIPTGLYIELQDGMECQVRPRSGLAAKHGITVLNSPGTIDADYRGELKIILINLGDDNFTINSGDRIAQIVFSKFEKVFLNEINEDEELSETDRGDGGFGHTGLN